MDWDCLNFFKEEVASGSATVRVGAANRLHLISSALGPQRTVDELIPYVARAIQEEPLCNDEEMLFNIAKQFAVLSDAFYIGARDDVLVAPLEYLAGQEETVIREQAIQSLQQIVSKRSSELVGVVNRLSSATEFFTPRVSACVLLPSVYRYASGEQKSRLREVYAGLCEDDAPMVRRAAAHRLSELAAVCEDAAELVALLPTFKRLSREDTQDTIRVSCVHAALVFARKLDKDGNDQHALPFIREAIEDRSWRVRLVVAKNFDQLCVAFGQELASATLVPALIQLLEDREQEVRKEAVRVIESCLRLETLNADQLEQLVLPKLQQLCGDCAHPVRAVLAQVLGPVACALGRTATQQQLFSLIHDLTKDEFPDVRLNISAHLASFCEVLGADGPVHTLLIAIQHLIMDNYWRIRKTVIEQLSRLAKLFGVEVFQSKLEVLCLASLRDSVHAVREVAVDHLKELSRGFGPDWVLEHFLPKVLEQYSQNQGYVSRVTMLHVLPRLCDGLASEQIMQHVMPVLLKATKDSVANVRFCACGDIAFVVQRHSLGDVAINKVIKPTLFELENDSDIDVQYFAQHAIAACKPGPA